MSDSNPLYYHGQGSGDPPAQAAPTQNGQSAMQNTKDSFMSSAQAALDSVQQNQTAQDFKNTVTDGPVAQGVKSEYATTSNEFRNLANARNTRPSQTAGTGQPLTHYHSMVYQLLSWENPRATAIAYLLTVASIFATRYLPVVRTIFRILYLCFGVTATAEVVGKLLFNNGFATQVRPRRYYTLPKGAVDRLLDDVHELMNFFVIEFQRVLFAENVAYTVTAFLGSLIAYYMTKFVPLWGMALLGTTVLYLTPLIYVSNKEVIDQQIGQASRIMNEQAVRAKELAAQNTQRATETVKTYSRDYSAKAQEYIGSARNRAGSAARDGSAKAQESMVAAKDRTASAANNAAARTQDTVGAAKDRTASATNDTAAQAQDTAQSTKNRTAATVNDYSSKAQEYLGAAKDRVASATGLGNKSSSGSANYQSSDFPSAPDSAPHPIADQYGSGIKKDQEPLPAV